MNTGNGVHFLQITVLLLAPFLTNVFPFWIIDLWLWGTNLDTCERLSGSIVFGKETIDIHLGEGPLASFIVA